MSDREQIIEAMAEALHGDSCPEDPDEGESCSCGSWQREAETALDAALPLLRKQLAERVRASAMDGDALEPSAFRAGMTYAARLIEEVEL